MARPYPARLNDGLSYKGNVLLLLLSPFLFCLHKHDFPQFVWIVSQDIALFIHALKKELHMIYLHFVGVWKDNQTPPRQLPPPQSNER